MYHGWASFGGTELFNAARTYAYAQELAPGFTLLDCTDCDDLALALGDQPYKLPILDEPSWFDPDNPDTYNFAGFYPLSVSGIEDSNREVEVLQSIRDGGVIGPSRLATKDVLVRGILVAGDPCALQAGMEWFKYILNGNVCSDDCEGDNLCFFYCCPDVIEGVVDPDSLAVPHDVSLSQFDWTVDSGRWRNGEWRPTTAPARAVGPLFEAPCDETIIVVKFDITEDQSIVLDAVGEDGDVLVTTNEVVLRRTNYARNPALRTSAQSWTAQPDTTFTKDPNMDAGIIELTSDVVQDSELVRFNGINQVFTGETYSARVTAELLPIEQGSFTNLMTNPRAEDSEYGWFLLSDPNQYNAGLSADEVFVGATSYKVQPVNPGNNGNLGAVIMGGDGTSTGSTTMAEENTDYYLSTMLRTSVQTTVQFGISFADENDNFLGGQDVAIPTTPDTWQKLELQATSPPGTAKFSLFVFAFEIGVAVQPSDAMWLDTVMITESSGPVEYFDGFYNNAAWDGTPNQSTSTLSLTSEDVCVGLDLLTLAGNDVNVLQGNEYTLSIGDSVELEITGVTTQDPGVLVGSIRACDEAGQGSRIRVTEAIITKTPDQVDYFDGFTEIEGYTTTWRGAANNSHSIMQIENDELMLTIPNGSGSYRPEITALEVSLVHIEEITIWARETIEPSECAERNHKRILRDVVATSGPTILRKVEECDHSIAEVEFTLTSANPYVWHLLPFEFELTEDADPQPLPPGSLTPARWPPVTHYPPGLVPAADDCPEDPTTGPPISDPNCPLPPTPPRPPRPEDCLEDVTTYFRRAIGIPGDLFSQWQEGVPIIELEVRSSVAVRQARVRFYPNPLDRDSLNDIDLCGFCGEFLISYMPGNSTFIIDGMTERARVELPGDVTREATHLLYGSDGGPMTWPRLTCGTPYIMTVDVAPVNAEVVAVDMSIAVRS